MTRALKRTQFHSSKLIRTLADLDVLDADGPSGAFAEKLGQWIGFADAIALCAVHSAAAVMPSRGSSAGHSPGCVDIADEVARSRAALENSIKKSCTPHAGKTRPELPTPKAGVSIKDAIAYEPYRRFHLAQQREMESAIRSLRARVRERMAKVSPRLKALVELDATLDAILGERESKLFATVPLLLRRRFDQLLQAHQQTLPETDAQDLPESWLKPGAWLAQFCAELKTVLLAELHVRLQTTEGLIEALNTENTRHQ